MRTMHYLWLDKKMDSEFLIIDKSRNDLSNQYKFECKFCGKNYGMDVIELAVHIGRVHDKPRNSF